MCDSTGVYGALKAAQATKLNLVGLLQYTAIVYGFIADVLVFHESVRGIDIIGALIIVLTTVGVSFYKLSSKEKNNV